MKPLITLAAALALALPALTAQANEVAGIKLGMSIAEAKSGVAASVKGLTTYPILSENKAQVGFIGLRGYRGTSDNDSVIAYQGDSEGIWHIERTQAVPRDKRFTVQALVKSLREKYGKESYLQGAEAGATEGRMHWIFDNDKRLVAGSLYNHPVCHHYQTGSKTQLDGPDGWSFTISTEAQEKCGVIYTASWYAEDGLVNWLSTAVVDYSSLRKSIQRRQAKENSEREQKIKQQSGVKPNL